MRNLQASNTSLQKLHISFNDTKQTSLRNHPFICLTKGFLIFYITTYFKEYYKLIEKVRSNASN